MSADMVGCVVADRKVGPRGDVAAGSQSLPALGGIAVIRADDVRPRGVLDGEAGGPSPELATLRIVELLVAAIRHGLGRRRAGESGTVGSTTRDSS